jgi:hypothetical protein
MHPFVVGVAMVCFLIPLLAHGQQTVASLSPVDQLIAIDSVATVVIQLDSVPNLHAYSVRLSYNVQVLRCTGVKSLQFLPGSALAFPTIDSVAGLAGIDEAVLGTATGSGSGSLAEMRFVGLKEGIASMAFVLLDLRDQTNASIPATRRGCVVRVGRAVGVGQTPALEERRISLKSYPNPFNSSTTIIYSVTEMTHLSLSVYDILGERVTMLVQGPKEGGQHAIAWDGKGANGRILPTGAYVCVLRVGNETSVRTLLLLR